MTWDVLNIIGAIAFAISGTLVATQENYDILGAYILGFTTAFGGGLVRNVLIGVSVESIWMQSTLFKIAFLAITIAFVFPDIWDGRLKKSTIFSMPLVWPLFPFKEPITLPPSMRLLLQLS